MYKANKGVVVVVVVVVVIFKQLLLINGKRYNPVKTF